jgi:hypothetical protein
MGFADNLREIIAKTQLQPGEHKLMETARTKLAWTEEKPPPFHVKVRNITRHLQGAEFSSKAVGIIVAKEHPASHSCETATATKPSPPP